MTTFHSIQVHGMKTISNGLDRLATLREIEKHTQTSLLILKTDIIQEEEEYRRALDQVARARRTLCLKKRLLAQKKRQSSQLNNKILNQFTEIEINAKKYVFKDVCKARRSIERSASKKINLFLLNTKMPRVILDLIYSYMSWQSRIDYLESVYRPISVYNKLDYGVKLYFIVMCIHNKLVQFPTSEKRKALQTVRRSKRSALNTIFSNFLHDVKGCDEIGAYDILKTMCLLFKKGVSYRLREGTRVGAILI